VAEERSTITKTKDALVIERVFDAPRELVWKAWTDPEQAMKWWGPEGFTAPVCKMDVRVGGTSFMAMQSPEFNDGRPIYSTGVYKELVEPERLVVTDSFADEHGNVVPASHYDMGEDFPLELLISVTFEDIGGGKTKMTLRHEGMPAGTQQDAGQGWSSQFDKLDRLLATASGQR
jgi:uncharacterized protein YndB with AHSA1/START domain